MIAEPFPSRGAPPTNSLDGRIAGLLTAALRAPLRPVQYWVWSNTSLRARNLLRFAETEAEGGRDLVRAAETTVDPALRRRFIRHAKDEQRHAELFRRRGVAILKTLPMAGRKATPVGWLTPGERGLDDLRVGEESDATLLAFLHLSEKAAAEDFAIYRDLLSADPATRLVFEEILHDETFHMTYTRAELARIAPKRAGWLLWRARLGRLWKGYLRLAGALAGLIGGAVLIGVYVLILPPFAWLAWRAERREPLGWRSARRQGPGAMRGQY